jgi:hypothetical protein
MRFRTNCLAVFVMLMLGWHAIPATLLAEQSCQISVATILAARDDDVIDAKLKPHISELQSMFNYTSYRLLGSESLRLNQGQSGMVTLPGSRHLQITPHAIHDNRADIDLKMIKNSQTVFETRIQLLNRGSLFVGGSNYLNGNLIFKISASY